METTNPRTTAEFHNIKSPNSLSFIPPYSISLTPEHVINPRRNFSCSVLFQCQGPFFYFLPFSSSFPSHSPRLKFSLILLYLLLSLFFSIASVTSKPHSRPSPFPCSHFTLFPPPLSSSFFPSPLSFFLLLHIYPRVPLPLLQSSCVLHLADFPRSSPSPRVLPVGKIVIIFCPTFCLPQILLLLFLLSSFLSLWRLLALSFVCFSPYIMFFVLSLSLSLFSSIMNSNFVRLSV